MNLKNFIRSIPDYQKNILFRDITTLIKDEEALLTINQIVDRSKNLISPK